MIDLAINHIASELNDYLRRFSIAGKDMVILANPAEADSKADGLINNKVVMFLAGVERDTVPGRSGDSHALARTGPTFLNLYLMVAANFTGKSYPDSLKYLSWVIAFFQQHPVFDRQSNPAMDEGIDRLVFDLENLDRRELNNIWGMFGGKYMPSVLYRVRMVSIDSTSVIGRRHIISEPNVVAHYAKGE